MSARGLVKPCIIPDCKAPARLHAGGWRCEAHKPSPFTSSVLGQEPSDGEAV